MGKLNKREFWQLLSISNSRLDIHEKHVLWYGYIKCETIEQYELFIRKLLPLIEELR